MRVTRELDVLLSTMMTSYVPNTYEKHGRMGKYEAIGLFQSKCAPVRGGMRAYAGRHRMDRALGLRICIARAGEDTKASDHSIEHSSSFESPNGGLERSHSSEVGNKNSSLDDRIMSGEFDDSGSTKEQLTRPLRKLLAKDQFGLGTI